MKLKEEIAFYKVCFDSMQVGILVCDSAQEIMLANQPLAEMFGYTTSELSEITAKVFFKNKTLFKNFIEDSENELYQTTIERVGVKKNGKEIPLEIIFGKVTYENNFYYKALITDISERKTKEIKISNINSKLEKEIKSQNKELETAIDQLKLSLNKEKELNHLKTKFIALASHEFKTPLSAILTSTELMIKYSDLLLFNKRNEHLTKVKTMVNHLNGMLDDFLTLENIESGNITPTYSQFKFSDLVNEIIEFTNPFLKENQKLTFENNVNDVICQDSKILKIIVTNLLYNAIKYSGENGEISVRIETNKSNIYFSIEDNGIGIPKKEQNLIFNRFFRAKNVLYYPGTGIGLNIVKGYVTSLNGAISFESIENKGTQFKVQLPKIKCHEQKGIVN